MCPRKKYSIYQASQRMQKSEVGIINQQIEVTLARRPKLNAKKGMLKRLHFLI